jgi:hypothetical protein
MRFSAIAVLVVLSGCGEAAPGEGPEAPAKAETVTCALDGSRDFATQCIVERGEGTIVVRHPDGKFRRLTISEDGQNLLAADGADQSQSARKTGDRGERWEVILGDDRYVIPAGVDASR